MERENLYELLEDKFLTFEELSTIPVRKIAEPMVALSTYPGLRFSNLDPRMEQFTGQEIYVRKSVAVKISIAQWALQDIIPGTYLEVVYGYRHISIQQALYEKIKKDFGWTSENDTDKEKIHRFVAVPSVSGHPTGGAIDVRIVNSVGDPLPMGTNAHDFVKDSYVFSPYVGKEAWQNRQLLRASMIKAGFAPFDGEWWHFSYGDREWAKYYNQPHAFYEQIDFRVPRPVPGRASRLLTPKT